MTELLGKAFAAMSKLPQDIQNQVAERLLNETLSYSQQGTDKHPTVRAPTQPGASLQALVGLIDEPVDVDAYLEECRGPAWDPKLDGGA